MKRFAALALITLALVGCASGPKTEEQKKDLSTEVQAAIERLKVRDPSIDKFFAKSSGYVVLPSVGKGGIIFGGAAGDGEVFANGRSIGYCSMNQGSIGATLGGQVFDEFIFFKDDAALKQFTSGTFQFAAQASAVMATSGAGAANDYQNGVAVFVGSSTGAMLDASIGGQNFSFRAGSEK
jgi:lipid-binding SYLF domain-containing protein